MSNQMVQFNTQQEDDAVWGMIGGRSIPALKFSQEMPAGSQNYVALPIGTWYEGTLAEPPQKRQVTDFKSKDPKFFKDGSPIEEIILTLNTGYADPANAEDDGQRRLFCGQGLKRALQDELRRLNIKRFGLGTLIKVTLTGFKPNPGGQAIKLYTMEIRPTEYVAPQEQSVFAGLAPQDAPYQALPYGGSPTPQYNAQAPQQVQPQAAQYVAPPQQYVPTPAGQQQAHYQAPPVRQAAPAAAAPATNGVDFAALIAQHQAVAAAAAPVAEPAADLTQYLAKIDMLIGASVPRDVAINAVSDEAGGDAAFRQLLEDSHPF
jgi:hypothetical protein